MRSVAFALLVGLTWWNFWYTPEQQAQRLMNQERFEDAAEMTMDPMRQGTAWFRAGEFKKAEAAFARLDTPEAQYNRGNCLIMMGKYDAAVDQFDSALAKRPEWEDAKVNKGIAAARAKLVEQKGGDMGNQKLGADEIRFDKQEQEGGQKTVTQEPQPLNSQQMQALWLKRVQTKPADFLKNKFAYQATQED